MTNLLIRKFIKDSDNITDSGVRTSYGILASIVGIVCNLILFLAKFVAGMVMHSVSVMADAFNNLSDAASTVIGFAGILTARKPADQDHPFGHGRMEYIAALVVSFLVLEVGLTFFKNAIGKIRNPEDMTFELVACIVLVLSVAVKLWMGFFNAKLGKKINSSVIKATAADSFGDAAVTTTTLISILVFRIFGVNIDGVAGIFVSVMVIYAGVNIARETITPLLGEAPEPEVVDHIAEMVEGYEGILGTHDLIIHSYGPSNKIASIHAEVPAEADIRISHEIIDQVEKDVQKKMGIFLVVHMDPVETENEQIQNYRKLLGSILAEIDEDISFHDLRMVEGKETSNLIFDVVLPFHYGKQQTAELLAQISTKVKEGNEKITCIIHVDRKYSGGNGNKK